MSYAILNNTSYTDDIKEFLKKNGFIVVESSRTFNAITDGKYKNDVARERRKEYYKRPEVIERRKQYMAKEDVKLKRKEYSKRSEVLERKKKQSLKRRQLIDKVRVKDPELYAEVMLSDDKQ
jgi:hypothetical protein